MRRVIAPGASALAALTAAAALAAGLAGPAAAQTSSTGPQAQTGGPTLVTSNGATVNGTVYPNGKATTYEFQYGPTTSYGYQTQPTSAGSGTTPTQVSATLSNLLSGTTYHYRVIAFNAGGTAVGSDVQFTTTGTPPPGGTLPVVSQATATNITAHAAQLNGVIDPKGHTARWWFEFGTTANYGTQTTPGTVKGGAQPINAQLTGLQAGQTYHFRLVAQSDDGALYVGPDHVFQTRAVTQAVPRSLSLTARSSVANGVTVTAFGRLVPPASVSRSKACRGLVNVQIKQGKNTLSSRRLTLRSNCSYSGTVHITAARLHGAKSLRVFAIFGGNAVLSRKSAGPRTIRA